MTRIAILATALLAVACGEKVDTSAKPAEGKATAEKKAPAKPAAPAIKSDKGVDVDAKKIVLGALNDESGPAAAIGKPYAIGKRLLAEQVNAGGSGILPDGWTVELVEKDHGYDPGKSQQAFQAIKDQVLVIVTSFGTPPTLPLRPFLQKENIVAWPASLSSEMASHPNTPPAGPSYEYEARRALDWVKANAEDAAAVKLGIVYDQTDYGKDGHKGFKAQAAKHGLAIAAERAILPGQKDFTADVTELKNAGATHVLLTVLPSSTGPILGTAAAMQFQPVWAGNTPSWIDAFFAHPKLPAPVFATYHLVGGLPFWAEDLPGMASFMAVYEKFGEKLGARPDFYTLMSYLQGRMALEAARRAIEAKDITRAGYMKALKGIKGFDVGGMLQPLDFSATPYVAGTKTRVLKPDFEKKSWTVVSPYADPK